MTRGCARSMRASRQTVAAAIAAALLISGAADAAEWPAKPVDPFFNINTPEDVVEAERIVEQHGDNTC